MLAEVPVQIGLLAKASIAQRASIRLLFIVNVPNVALKVGGNGKGSLTKLALVRLLTRVSSKVASQIR